MSGSFTYLKGGENTFMPDYHGEQEAGPGRLELASAASSSTCPR